MIDRQTVYAVEIVSSSRWSGQLGSVAKWFFRDLNWYYLSTEIFDIQNFKLSEMLFNIANDIVASIEKNKTKT